jgi:hypothetical protein
MSTDRYRPEARAAHEALSAYRVSIGEDALPAWEAAPEWMVDSTLALVDRIAAGNDDPAAEHEAWRAERESQGWTYGPVRDNIAKTNPLLVAFDALPEREKGRTLVQIDAIKRMLAA